MICAVCYGVLRGVRIAFTPPTFNYSFPYVLYLLPTFPQTAPITLFALQTPYVKKLLTPRCSSIKEANGEGHSIFILTTRSIEQSWRNLQVCNVQYAGAFLWNCRKSKKRIGKVS
jgi:hypothetical protein